MIYPGGKVNLPQSVRPSYFTRRGEPRPSKRKDDSNILLPPTPAQSVVELRLFVQVLVEFGFSKPVKADSLMTKSLSFGLSLPNRVLPFRHMESGGVPGGNLLRFR